MTTPPGPAYPLPEDQHVTPVVVGRLTRTATIAIAIIALSMILLSVGLVAAQRDAVHARNESDAQVDQALALLDQQLAESRCDRATSIPTILAMANTMAVVARGLAAVAKGDDADLAALVDRLLATATALEESVRTAIATASDCHPARGP